MNGGYRFFMLSRKLPGFREAVKRRPVGGDRSHGATFFYFYLSVYHINIKIMKKMEDSTCWHLTESAFHIIIIKEITSIIID